MKKEKKYDTIWDEMNRMRNEIDLMFNNLFDRSKKFWNKEILLPSRNLDLRYRQPLTDFHESEKEVIVKAELPGVNKEDIKVNLKDNGIEIKVEKKSELKHEDKKKGYYSMKKSYSGFYKYVRLPDNIDASKIVGDYKNGILELKIPKTRLIERKKEIRIN